MRITWKTKTAMETWMLRIRQLQQNKHCLQLTYLLVTSVENTAYLIDLLGRMRYGAIVFRYDALWARVLLNKDILFNRYNK